MRTFAPVLVAAALALSACGPAKSKPVHQEQRLGLLGRTPVTPLPKVEFTLTDTHGRPFDFRKETDGKITLLYFGYTYCPDICPLQMAKLSAAMRQLTPEVRKEIEVVFVTVDPERDTAKRLTSWLGSFDSSFIGLRGPMKVVDKALAFYHYAPPHKSSGPNYTVSHPAVVYEFTPDNEGVGMYGSNTTTAIWVHDLNLLAHHHWSHALSTSAAGGTSSSTSSTSSTSATTPPATSAATSASTSASGAASATTGQTVEILDAYAPKPAAGNNAVMYLTMLNTSSRPDTLLSVSTGMAESASLHETRTVNGMERMVPIASVPLPPGDTVRLEPGGRHVMLEGVVGELRPGSTFPARLIFARAGEVPATVRVVTYRELATAK